MRCAVCGKTIADPEKVPGPFCSERCQQLDLGRWLDERYTLPTERDPDDEEQVDGENGDGLDE